MKKLGRKKVGKYTESFRLRVIKSILEQDLGVHEAARQYGVSYMSIYRWLDQGSNTADTKMSKKEQRDKQKLEERLKALEEQLRIEQLRTQAYQEMIKQAEQYYNISIEKKSGSKQSKK